MQDGERAEPPGSIRWVGVAHSSDARAGRQLRVCALADGCTCKGARGVQTHVVAQRGGLAEAAAAERHTKGLSSVWMRMCERRLLLELKPRWQMTQRMRLEEEEEDSEEEEESEEDAASHA